MAISWFAQPQIPEAALTDGMNSRAVFMKGIDYSYYYEEYARFQSEEL